MTFVEKAPDRPTTHATTSTATAVSRYLRILHHPNAFGQREGR